MTLKSDWERDPVPLSLTNKELRSLCEEALPDESIKMITPCTEGCVNLNYKIDTLSNASYILRLYTRDPEAVYRESALHELVAPTVKVAKVHKIGQHRNFSYALLSFAEGHLLRDILLSDDANKDQAMYTAGCQLPAISAYTFAEPGFFDMDLNVVPFGDNFDYLAGLQPYFENTFVKEALAAPLLKNVVDFASQNKAAFPSPTEAQLVHADYNPANILMKQIDGAWQVSAVLDWEFAFSNSWLNDVANMLRYALDFPPWYQEAFLSGVCDAGGKLPDGWPLTIQLLDLISLLDCLARAKGKKPALINDIRRLLCHIIQK